MLRVANDVADWLTRHWLLIVASALALFVGLAVAAPVLDLFGMHTASSGVYLLYRLSCHQLPQRSWFIGGAEHAYGWPVVRRYYGLAESDFWLTFHAPIRDPVLGYQLALCQRDMAIFGALLATTVALIALRRTGRMPAITFKVYVLAALPIAMDGLSQLFGLRESTPLIRTLTGAVFGVATGLLVLPLVDRSFEESPAAAGDRTPGAARTRAMAPAAGSRDESTATSDPASLSDSATASGSDPPDASAAPPNSATASGLKGRGGNVG